MHTLTLYWTRGELGFTLLTNTFKCILKELGQTISGQLGYLVTQVTCIQC